MSSLFIHFFLSMRARGLLFFFLLCPFAVGYHCDFNNRTTCNWTMEKLTPNITGLILANGSNADKTPNDYFIMFKNANMKPHDRARLTSPWFSNTLKGTQCKLRYFVFFNGSSPGELDVKVRVLSGSQSSLVKHHGPDSARWVEQAWPLGNIGEPFRIHFLFTRGGDRGKMGLDDIEIQCAGIQELPVNRGCPRMSYVCSTDVCLNADQVCDFEKDCLYGDDENNCDELVPKEGKCTFEEGLCGWEGDRAYGYIWERVQAANKKKTKPSPQQSLFVKADHTLKNSSGHYIVLTEDKARSSGGKIKNGVLISPEFPAPPPETYCNHSSEYYQLCKVRLFFTTRHGFNQMYVDFVQVNSTGKETPSRSMKLSSDDDRFMNFKTQWNRVVIAVPESVTQPYRIKLRGYCFKSANPIFVDDISLTPECFGKGKIAKVNVTERARICKGLVPLPTGMMPTLSTAGSSVGIPKIAWTFTPCGQSGAQGPTQIQCDSFYKHKNISVLVIGDDITNDKLHWKLPKGTQVWTVPATGTYGVSAIGAAGGFGVKNSDKNNHGVDTSHGSLMYAKFNFTKGEKIYMVIGQRGESACAKVSPQVKDICKTGIRDSQDKIFFANNSGGGGGGGGATYVFRMVKGRLEPLLIAAGGGGRSYRANPGRHDIESHQRSVFKNCRVLRQPRYKGSNAETGSKGPGGGGGWNGTHHFPHAGMSLMEGALGGSSCKKALEGLGWHISGGFGGGGGACSAGGGGGGYIGGVASESDDIEEDGWFGVNYISPEGKPDSGLAESDTCGINDKDGDVTFEDDCPCEHFCIHEKTSVVCTCYPNHTLADDGLHCIKTVVVINRGPVPKVMTPRTLVSETAPEDDLSPTALVGIIIGAVTATIFITFFFVLFLRKQKHKRQMAMRLEVLTGFTAPADSQLERLRQTNAITEHNPHYDVCGAKCSLDDLMQTPRENLTLVSALGQGAFGEVYKGYLVNYPPDKPGELPVAVKTLPAMSTEQSEMDFLMEALIMSKFDHPYIVKFIGVCFEKHPRYLILELLAGGDLKSFLRDNRPKPFQPSPLTMKDLLQCAIDIAKGCQYLEQNHFIHRDIAARNCLLTSKESDRVVKIADFGMARDVYRADYYRKGGKAMLPVKWMPPEAFMDGIFTSKTDTWSFGILLWEVFSLGYMPYPGRGNQEVMQFVAAGGRLDPPTNCPTPVYRIMTQCWHALYERRPNFTTILERLDYCMQDPDVIDARLPTFSRRPSLENDFTIMRPKFTDPALSLNKKYMDSDVEDSTEYLLQSDGNLKDHSKKHPNMSASAESLDKLLTDDKAPEVHDSDVDTIDGGSMYSSDLSTPNTPLPVLKAHSNQSLSDKLDELDELVASNQNLTGPTENGYLELENGCLLSNGPAVLENTEPTEVVMNGFGHHDDEEEEEEDYDEDEMINGNDIDNGPLIKRHRPNPKNPISKKSSLSLDKMPRALQNGEHNSTNSLEKARRTSQTSQNSISNSLNNLSINLERVNNYYVKSMERPSTRVPNNADQGEWKRKNGAPPRQFESSIV